MQLYSLSSAAPPGFSSVDSIDVRVMQRKVFALFVDDMLDAGDLIASGGDMLAGIVFSPGDNAGLDVIGPLLWHITVPAPMKKFMKDIALSASKAIVVLKRGIHEKEKLRIAHDKLLLDFARSSEYTAIVERLMRDDFIRKSQWMVTALTELVGFAVHRLADLGVQEYRDGVAGFFSGPHFGYSDVALFRMNPVSRQWESLSGAGGEVDFSNMPYSRENIVFEMGDRLNSLFSVMEEQYCISLRSTKPLRRYSDDEHTFLSIFTALFVSYFTMKKLALEVEEKIVEVSNLRTSTELIAGLEQGTISLKDAVNALKDSLSLEGVLFAIPDRAGGEMEICISHGTDVADWREFHLRVMGNEFSERDSWKIDFLVDRYGNSHGTLSYKLLKSNPTLYAIQKRVMSHFITQLIHHLSEERLHSEAITDGQTNVYNRRFYMRALMDRLALARSDPSYQLAVAMLDIDHFKVVNDTCGHPVGDRVIKGIAGIIANKVRKSDLVGRYGGDEFIIILNADLEGACRVVESIHRSIEECRWDGIDFPVTVSTGIAHLKDLTWDHDRLISQADINLYAAKNQGRNRIVPSRPLTTGQ